MIHVKNGLIVLEQQMRRLVQVWEDTDGALAVLEDVTNTIGHAYGLNPMQLRELWKRITE